MKLMSDTKFLTAVGFRVLFSDTPAKWYRVSYVFIMFCSNFFESKIKLKQQFNGNDSVAPAVDYDGMQLIDNGTCAI